MGDERKPVFRVPDLIARPDLQDEIALLRAEVLALTQRLAEAEKRGDAFRDEAMAAKARRNRAEDERDAAEGTITRIAAQRDAALARAEEAEQRWHHWEAQADMEQRLKVEAFKDANALREALTELLGSLVGEEVPDARLSMVELQARRALAGPSAAGGGGPTVEDWNRAAGSNWSTKP